MDISELILLGKPKYQVIKSRFTFVVIFMPTISHLQGSKITDNITDKGEDNENDNSVEEKKACQVCSESIITFV